jgi:hypothetical protein
MARVKQTACKQLGVRDIALQCYQQLVDVQLKVPLCKLLLLLLVVNWELLLVLFWELEVE